MNEKISTLIAQTRELVELQAYPQWQTFLQVVADEGRIIKNRFHSCNNADERAVLQGESKHNDFILHLVNIYFDRAKRAKLLDSQK